MDTGMHEMKVRYLLFLNENLNFKTVDIAFRKVLFIIHDQKLFRMCCIFCFCGLMTTHADVQV